MTNVTVTKKALLEQAQKAINLDRLNKLVIEIAELIVAKNHDYGDAWQRYGVFTPLIRINDKTLRIKTLSGGQQALVADENIDDTLRDIIGYSLLALLWMDENGGTPNLKEAVVDKLESIFQFLDDMADGRVQPYAYTAMKDCCEGFKAGEVAPCLHAKGVKMKGYCVDCGELIVP